MSRSKVVNYAADGARVGVQADVVTGGVSVTMSGGRGGWPGGVPGAVQCGPGNYAGGGDVIAVQAGMIFDEDEGQ